MAMTIVCNGAKREVETRVLSDVLRELGYEQSMIATAVNGRFVPARQRDSVLLAAGDAVEVVTPRQGG
jgi:sulfur carrier protein